MSQIDRVKKAELLGKDFSSILAQLTDIEIEQLFETGVFDELLESLLDPQNVINYPTIAEFLLANKTRAAYIAILQRALTQNYSFPGTNQKGEKGFVSPVTSQWFEDGVMFLEGPKPFEGFLGVYRDGKGSYAVAARNILPGEQPGREDFEFIELEEFRKRLEAIPPGQTAQAEGPAEKLQALLSANDNDESKYQELLQDYPWVLGMEYSKIERHTYLDNKNIPDFTGIRVRDNCRDIFEIKPPFMKLFNQDGSFTRDFNRAWDQAEEYWDFANQQRQYLWDKGLFFENPECYLFAGYNLSPEEIKQLRAKERIRRNIKLRTYDDLFTWMTNSQNFIPFAQQKAEDSK